jgi:hypothetical protein
VTRADFLDYYTVVSATILDDSLFDLMLRTVWSIPVTSTIAHTAYHKPTQISWPNENVTISTSSCRHHSSYQKIKQTSFSFA